VRAADERVFASGGEPHDVTAEETTRAILNILEDFTAERLRLDHTQKAILNILEDFMAEKARLESTQKAMINILDDFDAEKVKAVKANDELRRENAERAAAEEALREKTQALARSNADLEQFAYVASHDLQEPLRMVSSYMQLLEKRYQGALDARADKYIAYAVDGAKRMQALIAGLLEYSRVGRQDEPPARVDTVVALEQALTNLRSALEEGRGVVTHDRMPAVMGNGAQITRVFQNLVGNAVKFRRPDAAPRIHVSAQLRGRDVLFSIGDNGIGIDPQYSDRVFVIFQRLHTRAEYPGTGIGLSVCKKVIERHGGRIWFDSEPGRGTTFWFTLPAAGERS
jgi:light-regulated signal transduction histidine kinase (bacteriophytochrome)